MKTKLPTQCPSCETLLSVSQLSCENCQTVVQGNYPLPVFLQLSPKEQEFILQFFFSKRQFKRNGIAIGHKLPDRSQPVRRYDSTH